MLLFDGESLFIYLFFSFFLHCSEVQFWGCYQKENKVEFSENMNIVSPKSNGLWPIQLHSIGISPQMVMASESCLIRQVFLFGYG